MARRARDRLHDGQEGSRPGLPGRTGASAPPRRPGGLTAASMTARRARNQGGHAAGARGQEGSWTGLAARRARGRGLLPTAPSHRSLPLWGHAVSASVVMFFLWSKTMGVVSFPWSSAMGAMAHFWPPPFCLFLFQPCFLCDSEIWLPKGSWLFPAKHMCQPLKFQEVL